MKNGGKEKADKYYKDNKGPIKKSKKQVYIQEVGIINQNNNIKDESVIGV